MGQMFAYIWNLNLIIPSDKVVLYVVYIRIIFNNVKKVKNLGDNLYDV